MFETLKKLELKEIAEFFGVDVEDGNSKNEIIRALDADGVTWDMYKEAFPDVEDQPDVPVTEAKPTVMPTQKGKTAAGQVLMKMTRANPTFQIRGYTFTKRHPFALVSSEDANYIIDNIEGFRIASPREAEEFYS